MGTEGIMGLFPEIPIIPAFPEIPENRPKKAKPFNYTNLPKHETQFLRRRLQIQRSAKKMRIGCTLAYCLFAFIFVSGSRCLPYRETQFLVRRG